MTTPARKLEEAVKASRREDYLKGMTLFLEVFGSENSPVLNSAKDATPLSYFGLCVAVMRKEFKPAIELCKRAITLEFYNGETHANLARVYLLAGNRKRAYETVEAGFKVAPEHGALMAVRKLMGTRARPAVPFLDRDNPINVTLGRARHAKIVAEEEKKRKTTKP